MQVNVQVLFAPQSQEPAAQVPLQVVPAEQLTWQGDILQVKAQVLLCPQEQVPLPQTASQVSLSPLHRA